MLSQEKLERINMNALYQSAPILDRLPIYKRNSPYHAMNWTFRPRLQKDGNLRMVDTFFCMDSIEVNEENFDYFRPLFDFNDVVDVGVHRPKNYDESDYYRAAVDSGGIQRPHYFLKKTAVENRDLVIMNHCREIGRLMDSLRFEQDALKHIANGDGGGWEFSVQMYDETIISGKGYDTEYEAYKTALDKCCGTFYSIRVSQDKDRYSPERYNGGNHHDADL